MKESSSFGDYGNTISRSIDLNSVEFHELIPSLNAPPHTHTPFLNLQ